MSLQCTWRSDGSVAWLCRQGLHVAEELAATAHEAGGQGYRVRRSGLDTAEFLLAAGPAEPLRPLGAVASGGESARVMLALKAAPALAMSSGAGEQQQPNSAGHHAEGGSNGAGPADAAAGASGAQIMVLDELDSGVGGRLGAPVARLLRRMSPGAASQILCVSHLPQVWGFARPPVTLSCWRNALTDRKAAVLKDGPQLCGICTGGGACRASRGGAQDCGWRGARCDEIHCPC